jgi:hypothetical protein
MTCFVLPEREKIKQQVSSIKKIRNPNIETLHTLGKVLERKRGYLPAY